MVGLIKANRYQIDFKGTNPEICLKAAYPDIYKLSVPKINSLKIKFVKDRIFYEEEIESCTTSLIFLDLLRRRSEEQIALAIVHICSDPTSKAIRRSVKEAIGYSSESSLFLNDPTDGNYSTVTLQYSGCWKRLKMFCRSHICLTAIILLTVVLVVSSGIAGAAVMSNGRTVPEDVTPDIRITPVDLTPPSNPKDITVTVKSSIDSRLQPFPEPDNPTKPSTTPTRAHVSPTVPIDLALSQLASLKNFSHPPPMPLIYLDSVQRIDFFHTKICDNTPKALNISLEGIFESGHFDIPCTDKISGLEISGNVSLQNLYLISQRSPNIESLVVNAQGICDTVDDNMNTLPDVNSFEAVSFPNLRFLQIKNLNSECIDLLKFISKVVSAPQLGTLILEDVSVQITNVDLINQFARSYPYIQHFSFDGKLCPKCEMFYEFNSFARTGWVLRVLNFQIHTNQSQIPGEKSVKNLILSTNSNSLEYFSSNVELTRDHRQENKAVFYKLINVKFLNISLLLDITFTQFSARFFTYFPNLIESYTKLNFNNSSVCKLKNDMVRITNLNKYIGHVRIRKFSLSARCNLVAVKGWQLPCRDYRFENNKHSKVISVALTATHDSYDCMKFWGD